MAPFQQRVQPWLMECFGQTIAGDREERNHRFLEEALELVQACGATTDEAHQLVDYVYGRPVGEKAQEVGGVMVTLAALCIAQDLDMHAAAETELARIWTKVEQIRAKQAAKPKRSPLPESPAQQQPTSEDVRSALLFALWHHQGGSSAIGQPIRKALGIRQHEPLNDEQLAAAKHVQIALIQADRKPSATAMLDWLQEQVAAGCVTMCFELDGGVHVTLDPVGEAPRAAREVNTVCEGIAQLMATQAESPKTGGAA